MGGEHLDSPADLEQGEADFLSGPAAAAARWLAGVRRPQRRTAGQYLMPMAVSGESHLAPRQCLALGGTVVVSIFLVCVPALGAY